MPSNSTRKGLVVTAILATTDKFCTARALGTPCDAPSSSTRQGVFGEDCAPVDTLSVAPFAGAGAETRSISVNTGAHDSDSAPAYARREPSQSHGKTRCVCLPRSSSAAALSSQAAQGHPLTSGRITWGGLLWVTFLGRARKVTSRRSATGLTAAPARDRAWRRPRARRRS